VKYTFQVGQAVRVRRPSLDRPSATAYRVIGLLQTDSDDIPRYRIQSLSSRVEWIARQDQLIGFDPLS
jgi:hypothetical protein